MKKKNQELNLRRGTALPLGVTKVTGGYQFCVAIPNEDNCVLKLYSKQSEDPAYIVSMTKEHRIGSVFSVQITNLDIEVTSYQYEVRGQLWMDPYAKALLGREEWGKALTSEKSTSVKASIVEEDFVWKEKQPLKIPYHELILYRLHVRGFTKHSSSRVAHKGTFLGIKEKIPYLKKLGINAIEIMPAYEFDEIIMDKPFGFSNRAVGYSNLLLNEEPLPIKLNYWGYANECYYFAPKASYAADTTNPVLEFKSLIQELHQNGIEIIMEFCFANGTKQSLILDCLRYWALHYHVDGFRINNNIAPATLLATDPVLSEVKLFATNWDVEAIYDKSFYPAFKNLAEYNDGFLIDSRRYLKGDEEQVSKFLMRMKMNPLKIGMINYITNTNGFTLYDLCSYDVKHNEANGENNKDGTEYNYSWNCGVEGKTGRKKVLELRLKQIKNALLMLFFSQGTPLLLAGDEFGNSQSGNNNAYCQDNEISWLNWNQLKINEGIYQYTKQLIEIRKSHKILHLEDEMRNMDYISCGFPDMSYHGTNAWCPDFSNYSRILGIMLCGKYARINRTEEDAFFYIAYNMHWEKHEFALPKLPEHMSWDVFIENSQENPFETKNITGTYEVKPRTIVVFIGRKQTI